MESVRVSASIDVHEGTAMNCIVAPDGQMEIRLGQDAYLFLTPSGASKLVGVLADAGLTGDQ